MKTKIVITGYLSKYKEDGVLQFTVTDMTAYGWVTIQPITVEVEVDVVEDEVIVSNRIAAINEAKVKTMNDCTVKVQEYDTKIAALKSTLTIKELHE